MSKPFKGVINVDTRDSVPDREPYVQPVALPARRTSCTSCSTTSASRRWSPGAA